MIPEYVYKALKSEFGEDFRSRPYFVSGWGDATYLTRTSQYDFDMVDRSISELISGAYGVYSDDDENWAREVMAAIKSRGGIFAGDDRETKDISTLAAGVIASRSRMLSDLALAKAYLRFVAIDEKKAADAEAEKVASAQADAARIAAEKRAQHVEQIESDIRAAAWNQSPQDLKNYLGTFLRNAFYFPEGIAGARVVVRGYLTLQDLEAARAKALLGAPAVPAYFGSIAGIYKAATGKDLPMNLASYSSAPTQVRFAVEPPGGTAPAAPAAAAAAAAAAPVPMPVPVGASVPAPVVVPPKSQAPQDYYSAYTEALKRLQAGGSSPFQASAVPVGSVDYSAGIPAVPEAPAAAAAMPPAPASSGFPGWLLPAAAFAAVAVLLTRGGPRYV